MRTLVLPIALLALWAQDAQAQSDPDATLNGLESRIERRVDREPVRARAEGEDSPITVSISSPLRYASNPGLVTNGAEGAFYVDPTIEVGGEWGLGNAVLTANLSADNQLFFSQTENDSSTLLWGGRATFPAKALSFYLDYTGLALFDGTFEGDALTLHQLSAGISGRKKLNIADTVLFDAGVTRRESELATIEFWRGYLTGKFKHAIDEQTALSALVRGRFTNYTGGTASSRNDKNILASLSVSNAPTDRLTVDFGVSFERNWSNFAGKDYSAFEAGHSVTFSF